MSVYPSAAVRELVANALIHQDFSITGTGPFVEIFDDRVEISNPGRPLVEPLRFVDSPPRSRNERLADIMRRAGICEERGSGWDKIGFQVEVYQLPAPLVEVTPEHTRVTLYGHRELNDMDRADRGACRLPARVSSLRLSPSSNQHHGSRAVWNRAPEQRQGVSVDQGGDGRRDDLASGSLGAEASYGIRPVLGVRA